MRLIPEEIAYLREKGKELEEKCGQAFHEMKYGDFDTNDGIKIPSFDELNGNTYQHYINECSRLEQLLLKGQIVKERNFDEINVGTGFYIRDDDTKEVSRYVLTEKGFSPNFNLISLDSNLGKAVYGKKDGDLIIYQSPKNKCTLSASIVQIDRIKDNYVSFIVDKSNSDFQRAKDEKNVNLYHYLMLKGQEYITLSQRELLLEEAKKLDYYNDNSADIPFLKDVLAKAIETPIIDLPTDGSIGIGSRVELSIIKNGVHSEKKFELIDYAVSTELDCDYVEHTSPLGFAVYGLKANDNFKVDDRCFGYVMSVDNEYSHNKERVR